jgi:hypothetical protein
MTAVIPDPPTTLTGLPRAFYDELREMLGVVEASKLSGDGTTVKFDGGGVELELVHAGPGGAPMDDADGRLHRSCFVAKSRSRRRSVAIPRSS